METSSIDPDDDPCVWKQLFLLLEGADVFISSIVVLIMCREQSSRNPAYLEFAINEEVERRLVSY